MEAIEAPAQELNLRVNRFVSVATFTQRVLDSKILPKDSTQIYVYFKDFRESQQISGSWTIDPIAFEVAYYKPGSTGAYFKRISDDEIEDVIPGLGSINVSENRTRRPSDLKQGKIHTLIIELIPKVYNESQYYPNKLWTQGNQDTVERNIMLNRSVNGLH